MALNNTQERLERSIYEAIYAILVREGYWPPHPSPGQIPSPADIAAIISSKGFAIQPFGPSSSQSLGQKETPRIALIPGRFYPGDLGNEINTTVIQDLDNVDNFIEVIRPPETMDYQIDIHLIGANAIQNRILTAIMSAALGSRGYIPFLDTGDLFFIRQISYTEIPDSIDGIQENVYGYEIKDIYIADDIVTNPDVPLISGIEIDIKIGNLEDDPLLLGTFHVGIGYMVIGTDFIVL